MEKRKLSRHRDNIKSWVEVQSQSQLSEESAFRGLHRAGFFSDTSRDKNISHKLTQPIVGSFTVLDGEETEEVDKNEKGK